MGAADSTSDDDDKEENLRAAFIMKRHEEWEVAVKWLLPVQIASGLLHSASV